MSKKEKTLSRIREEFQRWEALVARIPEAEGTVPHFDGGWSVKDVLAHLHGWQQLTNARLYAGLHGGEPDSPAWLQGQDPEDEDYINDYNRRIFTSQRELPWITVIQNWRAGFRQVIELAETIPESALFEVGRHLWLAEYPLAAVLDGTCEHHREHYHEVGLLFPPTD